MERIRELSPFQQALLDSVLNQYEDIPNEQALPISFSLQFCQWAEMYVSGNHMRKIRAVSIMRKILIAAIIAALLISTALAVPAVREAIIDFFATNYEERIGITFDPSEAATAPEIIETAYHITGLPEDYVVIADEVTDSCVTQIWLNDEGGLASFMQYIIPHTPDMDSWLGIDATDADVRTELVGDYFVEIITTDEYRKMVWTNNKYFFVLEIPITVSEEDLYTIFESCSPRQ